MRLASLVIAFGVAAPAFAQDAERGKALYETHCGGCHYERLHQRPRERSVVKTLAGLRLEVARRAEQAAHRFSLADLDDIAEYLDRSYYRFER
jgi:mono/diheme cytochrome c family protein